MAHIETFIQSAWQHLRADRSKQAMECAKKAHAISPNSPDVAHLLGLLASRDGKPEIALPLLQKAIDTGGKTAHRLRHIAEALLDAGYPEAALTPLNDAITEFGTSSDLLGLKSAIEIALEQWSNAAASAQAAIDLNPSLVAWELNLSFSQLMQGKGSEGFKNATARPENLKVGNVCPALQFTKPCAIWLKGEQGLGDSLFYLRYVAPLVKQGWQFHLEADKKLVPLLQNSPLFLSVKEKNKCPQHELCINLGDLPLMALQCGITETPPPLSLSPDLKLVEKYQHELAKLGPAPYIAVTWRGGPKGRKQRAGVATLEKVIDPQLLAGLLSNRQGTVINLQRLPDADEALAFQQALGKKPADYSALNNNLAGMLAMLSLVDEYYTVSNTNLHLREGLAKPSNVFVNRPLQDWRWQAEGMQSIWYPNSSVYRQDKNKSWQAALIKLNQALTSSGQTKKITKKQAHPASSQLSAQEPTHSNIDKHAQLLKEGWDVVANNIPEAIAKAQAVLKESPESPQALHLLGWAAVLDLKFEIAESVLQRATELAPTFGRIWGDYIRCLVLIGQCEKAINIGNASLNNPDIKAKSFIHHGLATAYSTLAQYENALIQFDLCLEKSPNHLDALAYGGMMRMKLGKQAILGFKQFSARQDARLEAEYPIWVCPVLKGDIRHLNILIMGDLGLGDELSCLRYLPYLVKTGAKITYWGGTKLMPLLDRLDLGIQCLPNAERSPDITHFDIAFRVHELPGATEHFDAPDVAPPLALKTDASLVDKWRDWLSQQGPAPYIGFNWRAGASDTSSAAALKKLNKAVDANAFASALSGTKATFISLQRNVTKADLNAFEQVLKAPVADAAGLADGLDDMLALQSLLDENIGVSNTNMHLRAGLGKGSRVLVQTPYGDWRWGIEGSDSVWFKDCKVYRESKADNWESALKELRADLIHLYGLAKVHRTPLAIADKQSLKRNKKIVWVTAGEIKKDEQGYYSLLSSAQERVVNVAKLLATKGWQSEYLIESVSELMGGWHDKLPVQGDVVVFSKVFTDHAITLMHDAKARGALVILDVFNDFSHQPERDIHQQKLINAADFVVSIPELQAKWQAAHQNIAIYFENVNEELSANKQDEILNNWLSLLELENVNAKQNETDAKTDITNTKKSSYPINHKIIQQTSHDVTQNRVLVGMLYSGENEFEQAKKCLHNQSHQLFEFFEICNLPNKQAHDQLYTTFMSKADECDYFLKLDADMVFAHENVLSDMLETMKKQSLAHLFAWVKDCPSGIFIPGIQMFKSDTKWLGSSEQLNVDYPPQINGTSQPFFNKNWINHMPNPDEYQLFRYGVHKALKSIQPDRESKNLKKGILHLSILNGIARNAKNNPNLWLALIGASLVYEKAFDTIEYNGEQTKKYFDILKNKPEKFKALKDMAESFWSNEVQVNYWWLDNFSKFKL